MRLNTEAQAHMQLKATYSHALNIPVYVPSYWLFTLR